MSVKDGKTFCDYCHISLGNAEARVEVESAVFHTDCDKKRTHNLRLRDFFLVDRGQVPIRVVPRHAFGR